MGEKSDENGILSELEWRSRFFVKDQDGVIFCVSGQIFPKDLSGFFSGPRETRFDMAEGFSDFIGVVPEPELRSLYSVREWTGFSWVARWLCRVTVKAVIIHTMPAATMKIHNGIGAL